MISQRAANLIVCAGFMVILALIPACGSAPARTGETSGAVGQQQSPGTDQAADRAATIAFRQVGVPYRYGGTDSSGFDCSGLVNYAYGKSGVQLPRTTAGLWASLRPVEKHDVRRGDIVFFRIEGKIAHVGLYLGAGEFVHAPSSGRSVSVASMDSAFYRQAYVRAGRAP